MALLTDLEVLDGMQVLWLIGITSSLLYGLIFVFRGPRKVPLINGRDWFDLFGFRAQDRFTHHCDELIKEGFSKNKNLFELRTSIGPVTVLSPKYADEIRNSSQLLPGKYQEKELITYIPGLDPFKFISENMAVVAKVVNQHLGKRLQDIHSQLWDEVTHSIDDRFGISLECSEILIYEALLGVVAQTSSRVFVGPWLCRDPEWIKLITEYTVKSMFAMSKLRKWPQMLQPFVHQFLPEFQEVRNQLKGAKKLLGMEIERRRDSSEVHENDCIAWFEQQFAGATYDAVACQMALSIASIHSTTDLLVQAMLNLSRHQELIAPLKEEILSSFAQHDKRKAAFAEMNLLDAVLRESQRLKPISRVFMKRGSEKEIELHDGNKIKPKSLIGVSACWMWDPELHPEPDRFNPYRHMDTDAPKRFTAAKADNLGFGYGKHACPGRFFVDVEAKMVLSYLIMNFEWTHEGLAIPPNLTFGTDMVSNPRTTLRMRKSKKM